ncbi:rRNA methylase [Mycoplasmopsis bovis]|nr:rRNA methylase [Mycoplasmopsis bovis]
MNQRITSTQNPKIKQLRKIFNDKNSEFFIVEGYHLVEEVLKENLVIELYELDSKTAKYDNSVIVSDNVLKTITKTKTPEGIVALCRKKSNTSELGNRVVFLDNVQDPGNVGTIIRAAKSFNFDTVISNVNFYNDKIVRSSQGALFTVNLVNYIYDDLHSVLKNISKMDLKFTAHH